MRHFQECSSQCMFKQYKVNTQIIKLQTYWIHCSFYTRAHAMQPSNILQSGHTPKAAESRPPDDDSNPAHCRV